MDWLAPVLSSAAIVALLELIKWRMGVNADQRKAREQRNTDIEDEYRGDLKGRVTSLEASQKELVKEVETWKQKYYELSTEYQVLQYQEAAKSDLIAQLEWRIKDLEARLTLGPDDIQGDESNGN